MVLYLRTAYTTLPVLTLSPLQRVQNAARLVTGLQQLHWLPVKDRIMFIVATVIHIFQHRFLSYLIDLVTFNQSIKNRPVL